MRHLQMYADERLKLEEAEAVREAIEMEKLALAEQLKELDAMKNMSAEQFYAAWPLLQASKGDLVKELAKQGHLMELTVEDVGGIGVESQQQLARSSVKYIRQAATQIRDKTEVDALSAHVKAWVGGGADQ